MIYAYEWQHTVLIAKPKSFSAIHHYGEQGVSSLSAFRSQSCGLRAVLMEPTLRLSLTMQTCTRCNHIRSFRGGHPLDRTQWWRFRAEETQACQRLLCIHSRMDGTPGSERIWRWRSDVGSYPVWSSSSRGQLDWMGRTWSKEIPRMIWAWITTDNEIMRLNLLLYIVNLLQEHSTGW